MADQTYLQKAQPSTFGHYLLSFAQPALRDAHRLLGRTGQINASPGGAGCVNGTRLQHDRTALARSLGFDTVISHTRDAMWRVDDLIAVLAIGTSLISNQSKLAEDLEIFSSSEFNFVDLDDSYSRSSVLMPQKRNPYALSIVRGASGVLIGRLTGSSPSPRARPRAATTSSSPTARYLARWIWPTGDGPDEPASCAPCRSIRRPGARGARRRDTRSRPTWPNTSPRSATSTTAPPTSSSATSCATASRPVSADCDLTAQMINEAALGGPAPAGHCSTPTLRQCWTRRRSWPPGRSTGGAAAEAVEQMLQTTVADAAALAAAAAARLDELRRRRAGPVGRAPGRCRRRTRP